MPVRANKENLRYLRTKRDRMGHDIIGLDEPLADGAAVAGEAGQA
ncbi:bifunctional 3,4-dihydroxy-2-butanone 4-phosphate synthase/GTP cyclohydrolase II protein [Mycobacteroides abscessus subsp. abscessus]|nr:bifunctional 3,4-dihydroxy-2-butanone 4-phosphate synthase/GTP cyclohydrolase II protein [Mycobacteroides abscessus subsp. abscessus]